MEPIGIIENATSISYEKSFNQVWTASFTLTLDDPKNDLCQPFNIIEIYDGDEYVDKFRIVPSLTNKNESSKQVTYHLMQVLHTLMDDVLFGEHLVENKLTAAVIGYLLDQQTIKHWKLGQIEFSRNFSYRWENENTLLGPILEIPKTFDEEYQWTWDTKNYPWTLNLVKPSQDIECELRFGKNQISIEKEVDPGEIYNRIYPLGNGEGVNQVNIKSVNNGVPYIEDTESINLYGLRPIIWVDQRFHYPNNLRAAAQSILKEKSKPRVTWRGTAADISKETKAAIDKLTMGKLCRIVDPELGVFTARIKSEQKPDIKGRPGEIYLEIGTISSDLGQNQADIEKRLQVNEKYVRGATNIIVYSYKDNCDSNHPATITFYIDEDVLNVNTCELTIRTKNFRSYSRATKGGGATSQTTSDGGAILTTTKSGGGSTSGAGGGTIVTSNTVDFAGEYLRTDIPYGSTLPPYEFHEHLVQLLPGQLAHNHRITLEPHTHSIPSHTHEIEISSHKHSFTLPDHTHEIEHGIYLLNVLPTSLQIKVDGNTINFNELNGDRINIIDYLRKDENGKVTRDMHEIEVSPNNFARIEADIILRVFIGSNLGGVY
jgi:phage minor structural protein